MITNYDGIIKCLHDDFKDMVNEEFLELIKITDNKYCIYNNKYNFGFNHESPGHANLYITENWSEGTNHFINNNYYHLKKRYNNRINNFREYLSNPDIFITFVLTTWNKKEEDVYELNMAIEKNYPNLQYKIMLLNDPNGKEYLIKHLLDMRYNNDDKELKRLL